MNTTTRIIARVNNVDIMGIMMETSKEPFIPVTQLCLALRIDPFEPQHDMAAATMVQADVDLPNGSKERMLLLPLEFAIGWIFSDEVREKAQGNIMQLHAALWDYIKNN